MSEENINEQPVENNSQTAEAETSSEPVSFLDSIDEGIRGEASLADIKDINGLAKGYVSAQRMLGNSVRIPGEDSSEEAKAEFYKKLMDVPGVAKLPDPDNKEEMDQYYNSMGRPESAQGYNIEAEGADPGMVDAFKGMAHELGLTNKQAEALVQFDTARTKEYTEHSEASREAASEALKKEWGSDYNNRLEGAKATINMQAEKYPDAVQELIASPLGNNPALLSILAQHHKMLRESGAVSPNSSGINYGMSSQEALEKINEIESNSSHPANDPRHPGNAAAVAKMRKLYQAAYPENGG